MSTMLSIAWEPEIRGLLTVIIAVVALCGSVYLILATNMGARLGLLVALAGLSGWMVMMGVIWMTYGIGLKGNEPSWKPAQPFTVVRDAALLPQAEVLVNSVKIPEGASPVEAAAAGAKALQEENWKVLPIEDKGRGQSIAAADEIIQVEAELYAGGEYQAVAVYDRGGERYPKISDELDFFAFFHKPHYAIVEIAALVPQRVEPGRAPARPVIDETKSHQYIVMIRDLGTKRQPALLVTFGSGIFFLITCLMLHRRDRTLAANLAMPVPAGA